MAASLRPTKKGRGDFGGIDNEALDFSQLEDYINDDEDNAIYFPDSLVASSSSAGGGGGGEVKTSHDVTSGLKPPPPAPSRNTPPQSRVQTPSLLYTLTNSSYKNGPVPYHPTQPHPLPESPPDSGSEPPFSPADEGSHGKVVTSSVLGLQEMLMHPPPAPSDAMKHLLNYTNTQPLKHLPSLGTEGPLGPMGVMPLPPPNGTGVVPGPPVPVTSAPASMALPTLFGSLNGSGTSGGLASVTAHQNKKRKLSESPNNTVNASMLNVNGMVHIKQEPGSHGMALPSRHCVSPDPTSNQSNQPSMSEEDYSFDFTGDPSLAFMEAAYQCIRFQPFQQSTWHTLCDRNLKELPTPNYRVDADKGFNFSHADDAFVCQKKNHFQVTVHSQLVGEAHFVKTPEGLKKIDSFCLHFNGAKVESPSQTIKVEQSQSDRSKKAFHPVLLDLTGEQVTKVTVGRLHFSETTSNNMRKKGKPNPDQRYFYLVVSLNAHCGDDNYVLASHASERIIVRASNPGQFENDVELCWQKGHTPDSIFHGGRVGINTDRPDEALVIHGNIKVTGHIMQPSDARAKEGIREVDTKEQLRNLQQLRIVHYHYKPDFASHVGLAEDEQNDTGVIAQEVQQVIPEAVKEAGDIVLPNGQCISNFLVVNKERIFMENVGAVKELCKVTDNLENRIDELERMNRKLAKLKRIDSLKSTSSGSTVVSRSSSTPPSTSSTRRYHHRPRKLDEPHGVCSNRFVQMTITILIIIMALCLVAMATLYILEWQNRHTPFESEASSANQLSELTTSPSNMTLYLMNESHGNLANAVKVTALDVPLTPSPRMRTGSNSRNTTSSSHPDGFLPNKAVLRRKPFPIGAPKHCHGVAARSCPTYCCSSYMDSIELSTSPRSNHISTQQLSQVPDNSTTVTPPPYLDQAPASTLPSQNIDIYNSMNKVNDGAVNSGFENAPNTLNDPPSNDPSNRAHLVRKREAKPRNLIPKTPRSDFDQIFQAVTIPELNLTLGREYCYNEQCLNRGGNYSYAVPISGFMPNKSLTLQFQLSSTAGVVIDLCHKVNGNHGCYAAEPSPYFEERKQGHNASWLLPIGYYTESSYRFRMPNREWRHQVVCNPDLTDAGSTFIEFNFVFFRKCEQPFAQPVTANGSKA